jgi:type VII secretion integral membrane protein EccD
MADAGSAELCRVTVVGESRRLDVALPADLPLGGVMPVLLRELVGEQHTQVVAEGSGDWVVQRLGEAPLNLAASVHEAGLRHGDVLYLRREERAVPPLAVDDVVDAIGDAASRLPGRWSAPASRALAIVSLGALVAAGALAGALAGPPWRPVFLLCATLTAALVVAAGAASRAGGPAEAALVFGLAAPAYAFVAGVALLGGGHRLAELGAGAALVGSAAVLPVAMVVALLVPTEAPAFVGVGVAAACGAAACLVGLVLPRAGASGAVAVALAVMLAPLLPMVAFRMSGLPMPAIPTSRSEIAAGADAMLQAAVESGARRADRFVTAMLSGLCLAAVAGGGVLAAVPGLRSVALLGVAALALTLRARHYPGLAQRLWGYGAGLVVLLEFGYATAVNGGQSARVAVVVAMVAVAAALALGGPWSGHRRFSPVLGRFADVVEVVAVLAALPAAALAAGVLAWARALGS